MTLGENCNVLNELSAKKIANKMQSCSIRGCQSYKSIQWKPVAYFKFPFNNNELMNSWLGQIDQQNFTPTIQDQICSTHFLIEDIEPSSIGRYPILKPDAVPTVFPEDREDTESVREKNSSQEIANTVQTPKFETVLIPDYPTKQIPILPKPTSYPSNLMQISPGSLLTSPTHVVSSPLQIQRIQIPSQLVKLPPPMPIANPLQLPPILPKSPPIVAKKSATPQEKKPKNPTAKTTNGKAMSGKKVSQLQEILENKKNVKKSSQDDKKSNPQPERRPILKISINKLNDEPMTTKAKKTTTTTTTSKKEARKIVTQKTDELFVKSSNKSVIFRLDSSGKIVVETIENKEGTKTTPKPKSKIKPKSTPLPVAKEAEKSPKRSLDPKLNNLKTLYSKAHDDCEKLSKKLATLKKRHQEEQDQITKLQGLMTKSKTVEALQMASFTKMKKRKILDTRDEEEENEYEKLLRDVRKLKEDRVAVKMISKDADEIKTEQITFDYHEPIVTQDTTINTTMSKSEHQRKLQKKVSFMKQALQTSMMPMQDVQKIETDHATQRPSFESEKMETDSEIVKKDEIIGMIDENEVEYDSDDEMNFEVEYLDPEFVDC